MEETKIYVAISIEVDDDGMTMPSDLLGVFTSVERARKACIHDMDYLMEIMDSYEKEVTPEEEWSDENQRVAMFRNEDGISGVDYFVVETKLDKIGNRISLEGLDD